MLYAGLLFLLAFLYILIFTMALKIEEVHQMAAQMIKKEYYQLLQSDEDEEKEDERKS